MGLSELFELGELLLSWRLFCGMAATGLLCWLTLGCIPHEVAAKVVTVIVGILGVSLSVLWQWRADGDP
jgi:hypothetical protein